MLNFKTLVLAFFIYLCTYTSFITAQVFKPTISVKNRSSCDFYVAIGKVSGQGQSGYFGIGPGENETWKRWPGLPEIKISTCPSDDCVLERFRCVVDFGEEIKLLDDKVEFVGGSCGISIPIIF
jgi:hypothetical protein